MCWNIVENAKQLCDSFVSLFTLTFARKYDILFSANKFGGIDLYFFSREVNFDDSYDVIVAGGGPAGVAAACSAAREGAKTLLIEATGALGGMSTMGLVPAWCPFSDGERVVYRGFAERILNAGKAKTKFVKIETLNWVPINPEAMKVIYDDLTAEFGVDVLFGTTVSAVDSADRRVSTVVVSNKAGLTAYSAKFFVDCTGDGDLSAFAGAEFEQGSVGDRAAVQLATHCFELGGVDDHAYTSGIRLHNANPASPIHKIAADDNYPFITDAHFCNNKIGEDAVGFNAGHLPAFDATDPWALSKAYPLGRKKAQDVARALADYYPEAFGNCFVLQTAPLLGIRESRRIVCDYTLTAEDYLSRATFPDEISRNCYYLDVHRTPAEIERDRAAGIPDSKFCARFGKGESHGIPYRSLAVKSFDNLLVAGRAISCDRRILGSVRVMPNCFTTGEAAGLAAALCLQSGATTHTLDTCNLREKLRGYGAYIN